MPWIDTPSSWVADSSLHAHITRQAIQDNLQAVYDNSASNIDGPLLCLAAPGYYTVGAGATWLWTNFKPFPIRVLRQQDSAAWRDINIEVLGELSAAGLTTLRLFLLSDPGWALDPVTGVVGGGIDYGDLPFTLAAQARVNITVTPTRTANVALEGISVPFVWARFAVTGNRDLYVRSIRIRETT